MTANDNIKTGFETITDDNLRKLLNQVALQQLLVAPVKNELGDVEFSFVDDEKDICFDYENTVSSPKEFFFPSCECMFSYEGTKNSTIKVPDTSQPIILFGIRSCDVKAIQLMDYFFQRDFQDDYYFEKRKNSILISIACSEFYDQCFCESTRTGPVLDDGFDIQLFSFDGYYVAQTGSKKGVNFVQKHGDFFQNIENFDIESAKKVSKQDHFQFDFDRVYRNLKQKTVSEAFWHDIGQRCQSCGLCLFLCPTCSCFTVTDQKTISESQQRVRQYDGCYFRGFTRIASGENVIKDRTEMAKRKYIHKLVQQVDEFNMSGCTGCGRCNLVCVGNVNWLENIKKIDKGV